ncbi:MAG: hypothetical protein ACUVQK_04650 [Thermogutta sp.]
MVSFFPKQPPLLEQAFEEAREGAQYVVTKYRQPNANLRTQFVRILKRAGIEPWERLFQNLRASRETDLANEYLVHDVKAWLGNSEKVASKYRLQATDAHFEQAQRVKTGATSCQNTSKPVTQRSAGNVKTCSNPLPTLGLRQKPLWGLELRKGK